MMAAKYKIFSSGAREIGEKYKLRRTTERFKKLCGRKRKTTVVDDRKI